MIVRNLAGDGAGKNDIEIWLKNVYEGLRAAQ